jgi:hypothetical protein
MDDLEDVIDDLVDDGAIPCGLGQRFGSGD